MGKQHVVSSAREFAMRARGTEQAYAQHLDEVAVLVRAYGDDHQVVAYLHHVLEGAHATLGQVEEAFGPSVASCIEVLADDPSASAKERNRLTYAKLARIGAGDERALALVVKVADRLADVRTCYLDGQRGQLRKYRRDHRDFRAAVFRPAIADELWQELNDILAT